MHLALQPYSPPTSFSSKNKSKESDNTRGTTRITLEIPQSALDEYPSPQHWLNAVNTLLKKIGGPLIRSIKIDGIEYTASQNEPSKKDGNPSNLDEIA